MPSRRGVLASHPTCANLDTSRSFCGVPSGREVSKTSTGRPRREFLAVDDLADACIFVMKHYSGGEFLNVGIGQDADQSGWHLAVLGVIVVARPIEIGRRDRNKIRAVSSAVRFDQLEAGDHTDSINPVDTQPHLH